MTLVDEVGLTIACKPLKIADGDGNQIESRYCDSANAPYFLALVLPTSANAFDPEEVRKKEDHGGLSVRQESR
jgi:hypothetical protein